MLPLWDTTWLFGIGAMQFTSLLPVTRMVYLAGDFGTGKTVTATYLAAWLMRIGLAARTISNLMIGGQSPVVECVPAGGYYVSPYLEDKAGVKRVFGPGERLPTEDTAIILDEAGVFIENWAEAKDYVNALRKTNLYFLMPARWAPSTRVRNLEVRRVRNWYTIGLPIWQYDFFYTAGRTVADKGTFFMWRPHRLFGVCRTHGYPEDDGGIAEQLEYTFNAGKIRGFKNEREVKRKVATINFGSDFSGLESVIGEMAEQNQEAAAWADRTERERQHGRNGRRR